MSRKQAISDKSCVPFENFDVLQKILSNHYFIGELRSATRSKKGYVNIGYEIETLLKGRVKQYFLRCYKRDIRQERIRFAHALLNRLCKKEFVFSPQVVETRRGTTCVKIIVDEDGGERQGHYISVFSFLEGEDRYSWDAPLCTGEELVDAAKVFAVYHNTIFGWETEEKSEKLPFTDYIPSIMEKWSSYAQKADRSVFDLYFLEQFDSLSRFLKSSMKFPGQEKYNAMPRVIIHGDYHPGNLKFQHEKVVGVFDFDWARMETRCFDVSLATNYFCTSWEKTTDGELLLERVKAFLSAYQDAAKAMQGLGALNGLELECLPEMMMMSNLSTIDWIVNDFYRTKADPEEYHTYLRHNVRLAQWLERNRNVLAECILKR